VAYLYPCRTIHSLTKRFTLPPGCDPDYISSRLSAQGILLVTCPRFVSCYPSCHLCQVRILVLLVIFPRLASLYPSCHLSQARILISFLSPVPGSYPYILLVICPRLVSYHTSCHLSQVRFHPSCHLSHAGSYTGHHSCHLSKFVSWYISCQLSQVCILVSFLSPVLRLYPGILLVTCPRFVFCGNSIAVGYAFI
jgi:hypothetical protein